MVDWSWAQALSGIVPPLVSPLTASGDPDDGAMEALVEHVLAGGCSGLFLLGGCGEGAWLTAMQRGAVTRAAVRAAAGRVPVLAGVMLPATRAAGEAARQAADEGADAVVVGSPYYFDVDAAAQQRHVEAVLGATRLPALLYNIPQCTHQTLAPETVRTLAGDPRVLGIKDSAPDFRAFQQFLAVRRQQPAFRVLQGNEALAAASLLQGADGLVPGLASVAPALFVALREAAAKGDAATCGRLQEEIEDLALLYEQGHWLPALKAALAALGLGAGVPAAPLAPAEDGQRRAIVAILRRHRLLA
ncbi:MAG: dihydrodipicolinate synthase family protein [Candidatus Rokubacteria bacterium]|nr:dihydrodipicolinate synthase family protein [Candidatus Rokubacteria bacterium]